MKKIINKTILISPIVITSALISAVVSNTTMVTVQKLKQESDKYEDTESYLVMIKNDEDSRRYIDMSSLFGEHNRKLSLNVLDFRIKTILIFRFGSGSFVSEYVFSKKYLEQIEDFYRDRNALLLRYDRSAYPFAIYRNVFFRVGSNKEFKTWGDSFRRGRPFRELLVRFYYRYNFTPNQ